MTTACKRIAITPGEPAGIGPDILIDVLQQPFKHEFVVIADPSLLKSRANKLCQHISIEPIDLTQAPAPHKQGLIKVLPVSLKQPVQAGELNVDNADYVLKTLNIAVDLCLNQTCVAMVTGPVHKGIIAHAGYQFSGHTEYLARLAQVEHTVMMLMNDVLKVALFTTHIPLHKVSHFIKQAELEKTIRLIEQELKNKFAITKPTILVCGLNPHAGESGTLGYEEIDEIQPAIKKLQHSGIQVVGPIPADTAFTKKALANVDVVLAMYHDQGLPVIKSQSFGEIVNVTLGLPFIRTSVDHGTALELAGTGQACSYSLVEAIRLAEKLAIHFP